MFQKPFRIKSNSQMKRSERKAFKSKLLLKFDVLTVNNFETLFPSKEPVSSIKAITHSNSVITIYLVQKRPMIFEHNEKLYPTIYFLWHVPNLLLTFTTHPPVLSKLVAGADLMLPGVVLPKNKIGPSKYGHIEKGTSISINLTDNKAPVAVGTAALSSMDMYMSAGRGKCVNILHCFGDKLWAMDGCQTMSIPELGPPDWLLQCEDWKEENKENHVAKTGMLDHENIDNKNQSIIDDDIAEIAKDMTEKVQLNNTYKMDNLFVYCCLKVLKYSGKKLALPLLTSSFYRLHMKQACPEGKTLDLKKTSFKKFSNFLKKITKEGIIQITEQPKGVENITSVNINHQAVATFILDAGDVVNTLMNNDDKQNGPDVSETCTINASVLPIFEEAGFRKGDSVKIAEVNTYIKKYIKKHNLRDKTDGRFILPNEELSSIVQSNKPLTSEDVMYKVSSSMGLCYRIISKKIEVKGKGKIVPICLSVSTRSGNKKVTFISNLELYGIRPQDFGKECQHGVAASTSVSRRPGKKYDRLLVQGNQVLFVGNLLMDKYKIPKKYILGLELAIKK